MNVMIKGVAIAAMLTLIACSNEAEVSEETVVDEALPAFGTSLPVAPVAEDEVDEEEPTTTVADSIAEEV
jgi:hypothetical protein